VKILTLELRLGYSKKGWTTGEIGVTWIQEFDKQTSQKASGKYHLLLVDGHNSHYTRGFLEYARLHMIVVICYPSHGTHVYQGLDVVIFAVLKKNWSEARDEWERSTGQSINKKNFLAVYGPAHLKTLTCENICAAFWKTGVWPSNPHVITSGMMAPSKETSIQGSLPVEPATPIKLVATLLQDLSLQEDGPLTPIEEVSEASYNSTVPSTPTPVPVNHTTSNDSLQDHISSLIDKLSRTQLADLVSSQPLTSTFEMPSLAIGPIEPSEPSNMLDVNPSTTNEVLLLAALREAEEQCTMYKKCVIALQAQAVLTEAYCNKLRYQLAFKEEKLANPDVPGKLVEDGLPWLLSGDEFYERVVKFTQWQKEKAQEKEVRKERRKATKIALDEWKKAEIVRKAENREHGKTGTISYCEGHLGGGETAGESGEREVHTASSKAG
jgi:hypothetical protein